MTKIVLLLPFLFACTLEKTSSNLQLYQSKSVLVRHSNITLSEKAQKSFNIYKSENEYYSAFAINFKKDLGVWGGGHSIEWATEKVLEACKLKSRQAEPCTLYATIIPQNYTPNDIKTTLSKTATEAYYGEYKRSLNGRNYGAVAINQAGGFGWSTRTNKKDVIPSAIEQCENAVAKTKQEATKTWKRYYTQSHYKCRVVEVSQ